MQGDRTVTRNNGRFVVIVTVVAVQVIACARPSVRVSCEQLRSLRIGMSKEDVIQRLGQPVTQFAQDSSGMQVPKGVDWILNYGRHDTSDGVRLFAEFSRGRLVYVTAYRKPLLDDSVGQELLFTLDTDGVPHEGADLSKWVCSR